MIWSPSLKGVLTVMMWPYDICLKMMLWGGKGSIGINKFSHNEWPNLHYAVKDAKDMGGVLQDSTVGNFDYVHEVTNANKKTILDAIDSLSNRNMSKDDTVLIYISSHGTLERGSEGRLEQYLVTAETDMNAITTTALSLSLLKQKFNTLRSQKKVLILAVCYSGFGKSGFSNKILEELSLTKGPFFVPPLQDVSEATIVLSSSSWGETAREDNTLKNDITPITILP